MKNTQLSNFRLSIKEMWRYDKKFILVLIIDIIVSALVPFPNIIFAGKIIDNLTNKASFSFVLLDIFLMFGMIFLLATISNLLTKSKEYLFIKLTDKLNNDINMKCLNMDYEQFNDSSMQNKIMLVNQIILGNNFFTSLCIFANIISQIITLIGVICIMSYLNIWLLVISVVIISLQALLHYIHLMHDRKYQERSSNTRRCYSYISQLAKDQSLKKDTIIYGMKNFIMKKINSFQQSIQKVEKKRIKESCVIETIVILLNIVFQVLAYILIGIKVFNGIISIGDFTIGVTSLINFMSSSSFVTTNIITFNENFLYVRQYKSFLKLRSKFDEKAPQVRISDIDLNNITIEFKNVSFRYPNSTSYVLKNLNFVINNSEHIGIVGYNGAGKTSLMLLLMRMYDPTDGEIILNGINIKNINYEDYQKMFSTVNQDFSLLAFSLLENTTISDENSSETRDKITSLFNNNGLGEKIKKLYRGIDTPITKVISASGIDLSGGERQKVAIVRALYKDSPILILDEPTSALDPSAEHEIFKKFDEMSTGKTSLLISHRIYSTKNCDKIIVLENGEIKESGNFEELMQKKGLYYNFFQQQSEYFK